MLAIFTCTELFFPVVLPVLLHTYTAQPLDNLTVFRCGEGVKQRVKGRVDWKNKHHNPSIQRSYKTIICHTVSQCI